MYTKYPLAGPGSKPEQKIVWGLSACVGYRDVWCGVLFVKGLGGLGPYHFTKFTQRPIHCD